MEILEPQYGDRFVGRWEKIKELRGRIKDSGIVVVKGDRGIGKTNLLCVTYKTLKNEGKKCHFIGGNFREHLEKIFELPWYKRISGVSVLQYGGVSLEKKDSILESLKKSEEKTIFVEDAQKLDETSFRLISDATRRNNKLRFVLEIPTPYMKDIKLKAGSYNIVDVEELDYQSTTKLVKNAYHKFSEDVVKRIVNYSKGYPYVARVLVYICVDKKYEKQMLEFLNSLKDDEIYKLKLDQLHNEVLVTLTMEGQEVIKKLGIAPKVLTLELIKAFVAENIDAALSDIIKRGILRSEKKSYWIYHPLFRDYLRNPEIQPIAIGNIKEIYCKAMEKVKSEYDSIFILNEVLNEPEFFKEEPDIFNELIEIAENYDAINSIGIKSYTWGELSKASLAWARILKSAKEKEDRRWESIALGNIGIVYKTKGELEKALEHYGKALEINEKLGNKEGMAANYGNIGTVYQIKGELEKALKHYGKSLEINEKLGSKEGMAANYGNIGNIYRIKGELEKALEHYRKALEINEKLGSKEGMAANYGNIGIVYGIKGELDKALEYYEKALKINEELERKEGMAIQLGNIGIVYETRGELDKALEYYEKALMIFRNMGNRIQEARALMDMGDVLVKKGEKERAIDYYLEAQELAVDSPPLFNDINKRVNTLKGIKELEPAEKDPSFDVASLAVETGISDLAVEHNHYLYGTPKRGKKNAR